jgi:tetratricopeptide (TPR) repeat protein
LNTQGRLVVLLDWAQSFDEREGTGEDFERGLEHYRELEPESRKLGSNNLLLTRALSGIGDLTARLGQFYAAETAYSQALAVQESEAPGSPDMAHTLTGICSVLFNRGDLAQAKERCLEAQTIGEKVAPDVDFAWTLNTLGDIAEAQGDLVNAEKHHRAASDRAWRF